MFWTIFAIFAGIIAFVQFALHLLGWLGVILGLVALVFGNQERGIELLLGGIGLIVIKYLIGFIFMGSARLFQLVFGDEEAASAHGGQSAQARPRNVLRPSVLLVCAIVFLTIGGLSLYKDENVFLCPLPDLARVIFLGDKLWFCPAPNDLILPGLLLAIGVFAFFAACASLRNRPTNRPTISQEAREGRTIPSANVAPPPQPQDRVVPRAQEVREVRTRPQQQEFSPRIPGDVGAMRDGWFYADGQKPVGPLEVEKLIGTLRSMADPGSIKVWHTGFPDWRCAKDVQQISHQIFRPPQAEREVLRLAADGATAKQMAQALGISERSVEGRIVSAIKTLQACNRTHAVAIALRKKFIE